MAVTQLKDGRWICYYRVKGEGGKSKIKKEYFGRGAGARAAAQKRNEELDLRPRRSRKRWSASERWLRKSNGTSSTAPERRWTKPRPS